MLKITAPIAGNNVRLRLATQEDARFLFDLRSDENLTRYIPPVTDFASHCAWLERNLGRVDDYLFVAEEKSSNARKGTIAIHDISLSRREGCIGRWVMQQGSVCGFEAIKLAYHFAFSSLPIDTLWADVLVANRPVLAFHLSVGLRKVRQLDEPWTIRGVRYDVLRLCVSRDMWPVVRQNIEKMAAFISSDRHG